MVYVTADGTVHQSQPWGFGMIADYILGIMNFVSAFFRTLIPISDGGGTSGSGNRGRGSPGGPGGPGEPDGPNRRIGRITTTQECNMPGGGCGR